MPHGYNKTTDTSRKCVYTKTHRNGEQTKVIADKVDLPDEGERWTPHVQDEGETASLGKFKSKQKAIQRMKQWMRQHPKGLRAPGGTQFGGGLIPGTNGAGQSNDFWG